ncbi:MAG: glutamine amidotransferase, partial [Candidatus Hydrogenedentes bacterium]|nr:glutamine amidotransferase [Candidatus Hydrogenedentota bacterium]
ALEEIKLAQAEGIAVDVVPVQMERPSEVRVREVSTPQQANTEEPFQLRIVVTADEAGPATLNVLRRTGSDRQMLAPQPVQLKAGDNVFVLTQEAASAGFFEYEVRVDAEADTVRENNVGRSFTTVHGQPRVLYIDANTETAAQLREALEREGIVVEQTHPGNLPSDLAQVQNYDGVILADVSATELSPAQLNMLEAMVRDHGIGLTMIGGPNSFGAGGYLNTPVEKVLPVSMDIKEKKVLPRGALIAILHTCEFADGNAWAAQIAKAALNVLSSRDLMGVLGYLYNPSGKGLQSSGDNWVFELQPVGDKTMMRSTIDKMSRNLGDMPDTTATIKMAYQALLKADAGVKRVILISDGDPAAPPASYLKSYRDAGISISTICINPHSMSDQNMLRNMAKATGGEYYFVNDPRKLPQIFTKEAAVVKMGVFRELEFVPQTLHNSELLYGLATTDMPSLQGYVVTFPKETATVPLVSDEGDPILAHWRYGLGKAVAFTSDASNRWGVNWLSWEGYDRFWAQTVRWSLRELTPSEFRVETRRENGHGVVRIDAVDGEGNFINFLRPKGVVTTPGFASQEISLTQSGPGIYEGTFPIDETGVYMVNLTYADEGGVQRMIPTGLAVDYSAEYEFSSTNTPLLEKYALLGGGRLMDDTTNPFEHDLVASANVFPIWHWLAALAACLLLLEIFIRRVMISPATVFAPIWKLFHALPGLKRLIPAPPVRPQPVTGVYRAAAQDFDYGTATETPSFGTVTEPSSVVLPTAMRTAPESARNGDSQKGNTDYTSRLLAAKERAQKQTQKGGKG